MLKQLFDVLRKHFRGEDYEYEFIIQLGPLDVAFILFLVGFTIWYFIS